MVVIMKNLRFAVLAACLLVPSMALAGGSGTNTTVTVNATVEEFFEWTDVAPSITLANFTASAQTKSNTVLLTVWTNKGATITPSTADGKDAVLTKGTEILTTVYKMTGADLVTPDNSWKTSGAAGTFNTGGNSYTVQQAGGTGVYTMTMNAQATTSAVKANDAGAYSCQVVLTATWS
jgi:hypothetical protein